MTTSTCDQSIFPSCVYIWKKHLPFSIFQTPARKLQHHVSTGHADSPVTIVVGRAHKQKILQPTGAAPKLVQNIALFKKNMKMDEDLTGNCSFPCQLLEWQLFSGVHRILTKYFVLYHISLWTGYSCCVLWFQELLKYLAPQWTQDEGRRSSMCRLPPRPPRQLCLRLWLTHQRWTLLRRPVRVVGNVEMRMKAEEVNAKLSNRNCRIAVPYPLMFPL